MTMKYAAAIFAAIAAFGAARAQAQTVQVPVAFIGDANMQTQLIKQFPIGVLAGPQANFMVPAANVQFDVQNVWDAPAGSVLSFATFVPTSTIYLLAAAYFPPTGAVIATVNVVGNDGTTYSKNLVAGRDIRDFCQTRFANTINNTTTVGAYQIDGVQGGCGTGDVTTGLITNYVFDEIQITLPAALQNEPLAVVTITPSGKGRPVIAGITLASKSPTR